MTPEKQKGRLAGRPFWNVLEFCMEYTYHGRFNGGNSIRHIHTQAWWWSLSGETPKYRGKHVSGFVDDEQRLWVDLKEFTGAISDKMIGRAARSALAILECKPNRAADFGIAIACGTGIRVTPLLSMRAAKCLDECAFSSVGIGRGSLFWQYAGKLEWKARRYKPLRDWDEIPDALDRLWRDAIADEWKNSCSSGSIA